MAPTNTHRYTKISSYTLWTATCFGHPRGHLQGYNIKGLDTSGCNYTFALVLVYFYICKRYEEFQNHINLSLSETFLPCLFIVRDFINCSKTMTNQRAKGGELREVLSRHPLVRSAISACWMHRCPSHSETANFAHANNWASWLGHPMDL